MAGPGGGPPRRSHTKSRKGCENCKKRHIRCDENFPQCRNCTKHKVACPYNQIQASDAAARSTTPDKPDLMWTDHVVAAIDQWKSTGVFPFPSMGVYPAPDPAEYSNDDLRLIHHVASVYDGLVDFDGNQLTLWTRHIPTILRIGATTPYVMHALLSFSATHLSSLTNCPLVGQMCYSHRSTAYDGLREGLNVVTRETCEAALATSLVLSWQANDWREWTQLMTGINAIVDRMGPWKYESQFQDLLVEGGIFPTVPSSPGPDRRATQPSQEDTDAYERTIEQMQKVEAHLKHQKQETSELQSLIGFAKGMYKHLRSLPVAQQFDRLQPLRNWLFWMPINRLQRYKENPNSLVVVAHLYSVALLMERLLPDIGAAYFGRLTVVSIDEIARRLVVLPNARDEKYTSNVKGELHTPLTLIEYPMSVADDFRNRMGLAQPQRASSFPQPGPPDFTLFDSYQAVEGGQMPFNEIIEPGSFLYLDPSFAASAEEMPMLNAPNPPPGAVSPLTLSPFPMDQAYLGIPSPSFGGSFSPASSTFEGSITYSDNDDFLHDDILGFDFGSFGGSQAGHQSPVYSHSQTAQQSPIYSHSQTGHQSPVYSRSQMGHQSPAFGHSQRNSFGAGFVSPQQIVWT